MNRRDFLRSAALSGAAWAGVSMPSFGWAAEVARVGPRSNAPRLARRPFGKTGVELSLIGFPGFALKELEHERVGRLVAEAYERGVNYFDVAPSYGDAEERLGPALEPYRKDVFLACKTAQRGAEGAAAELKASFDKLRTDHFDLYQLHHLGTPGDDYDKAFMQGGALEALIEAKKEGRVRFLGFSAHSEEAALTAMDRYDFDSALVPINFACLFKGNWGHRIIQKAQEKGVTLLALKPLARQHWPAEAKAQAKQHGRYRHCWYQPITDLDEAQLSLRYTLSQPVAAAIPPASPFLLKPAVDLAMDFTPTTPAEADQLKSLAATLNPLFPHV